MFAQGCNLNCSFCYNQSLLPFEGTQLINEDEVIKYISKHKDLLDAVVVTGGEPTLQPDLPEFLAKIKSMGFLVKLDTNGTNPEMLERILDAGLVDYAAMDVKMAPENYKEIMLDGREVDAEKIRKSIEIVMGKAKDYEFRTTVVSSIHDEFKIEAIGKAIQGAKRWYLQNADFRFWRGHKDEFMNLEPFSEGEMEEFRKIGERYVKEVLIR